jgi:hypothetical protein
LTELEIQYHITDYFALSSHLKKLEVVILNNIPNLISLSLYLKEIKGSGPGNIIMEEESEDILRSVSRIM